MPDQSRLLHHPADRVARQILSRELAQWVRSRRRLGRRRTSRALHDFRVALRRLRSTLRAFRAYLQPAKGLRSRLRSLAGDTNESRNLEIWQGWVSEQAKFLTARQAIGVRWLQGRLRTRKRRAELRMRGKISGSFAGLQRELEAMVHAHPRGGRRAASDAALAAAVRDGRADLRQQLTRVHSLRDREAAHEARIAAKRLRYLLEPFAPELAGGGKLVDRLELLQDVLGEIHDAHVFADELRDALTEASEGRSRVVGRRLLPWPAAEPAPGKRPPPGARVGLLALARRLRADGEQRFERLRAERRKGTVADLLRGLTRMGRGLREGSGRPDLNRRLPAPKAGALPD